MKDDQVVVRLAEAQELQAPVMYTKPVRVQFHHELAVMLGCQLSKSGSVLTDAGMQTSVPGVFAAGDLSHPDYHQVAEAISILLINFMFVCFMLLLNTYFNYIVDGW